MIPSDARGVSRIDDGDGFGMTVLGMVFFCVNLFVFLEILGALERFLAYLAHMGLQRGMYWK